MIDWHTLDEAIEAAEEQQQKNGFVSESAATSD